jgi:hypothetical protein
MQAYKGDEEERRADQLALAVGAFQRLRISCEKVGDALHCRLILHPSAISLDIKLAAGERVCVSIGSSV